MGFFDEKLMSMYMANDILIYNDIDNIDNIFNIVNIDILVSIDDINWWT